MAANLSANPANLRLHVPDLRLHPPSGWEILDREGFVVHVDPRRQSPLAFALSVAAGLDRRPRRLEASFLYDAAGSRLFDRITELPEYYLTRAEDGLLVAHARALREAAGPGVLVELGSGASTKTWRLLDAWTARGPTRYVPVDVDVDALVQSCEALRTRYPSLAIEGIGATYERGLSVLRGASSIGGASALSGASALGGASALSGASAMTVAFLGSSLGNLGWREYPEFCQTVADALEPGDHFLVGVDLVKNAAELEAAYNDAAGVTAAFTRNLFARMNRELGTTIADDAIEHVAFYDVDRERIEIFAEARREFVIRLRSLDREFRIARGERILTEVSHKFRPEAVIATVEGFGFRLISACTGDGAFGLFLFRKVDGGGGRNSRAPREIQGNAHSHLGALTAMRTRTLELVEPLDDEALLRQHSPLMSPISWDMGHIAHFEQFWLLPGDSLPGEPEPAMFRLYDPLATPRARRAQLPLPSVAAVRGNLRSVRVRVEERLSMRTKAEGSAGAAHPSSECGTTAGLALELALPLVVQHEAQHQETMLQAIGLRDDLDYRPAFVEDSPPLPGSRPHGESVLVPAGRFEMGTHDRRWAYDNERPAHEVDVAAFRMDVAPVTNRQYFAFMAAGGYDSSPLWSEAGWSWLQNAGVDCPGHWRRRATSTSTSTAADTEQGWARGWQAMVFGRLEPLHPDHPVVHVSFHEATAYARWAGARLPTEAEWEKAAAWDPAHGCSRRYPWGDSPWEPARANLDQLRLAPTHAGAHPEGRSAYGCLQMLGDVWEWTDSWFHGYPGFESFPYREYSEIFFGDTYRVLRGGSFATRAVAARNTFRNWDLPERRQIFAGFRCVRPA